MELAKALARTRLSQHADAFRTEWDTSQAAMPKDEIPFLQPDFVRWACEAAYVSGDLTQRIVAAAKRIADDDALCAIAWYCHDCLFRSTDREVVVRNWPLPMQAHVARRLSRVPWRSGRSSTNEP